jgi:NTE family protein
MLLERQLGYHAFEQARIPLSVMATDLVTGCGLAITQGDVVPAVQASSAVPGLLPPQPWRGRLLVDGAVGGLDSLAYADALRPDDIYLLPAGYACAGTTARSALSTGLQALSLLLHRHLISHVDGYRGRARLHVVPPLCPLSVSPADFTQARALIQRGADSTRSWLLREPVNPSSRVLALHAKHQKADGAEVSA